VLPWTVIRGWRVMDRSDAMLIMEHELFRHIEIEAFVRRDQLAEALAFTEQLLRQADGEPQAISAGLRERLAALGLWDAVAALAGKYTHHYPICIRKVLADDTLISMASGDGQAWYALSFVSYARPGDRDGFFRFARALTEGMTALFNGRLHWGKACPLTAIQAEALYPHLPEFRRVARRIDPQGVFRNRWVTETLFADERTS
jgi:FAD/FMN-containing dehydrogenase